MSDEDNPPPSLLARTDCAPPEDVGRGSSTRKPASSEPNYVRSASFSPDGTTVITTSADPTLRSYIL